MVCLLAGLKAVPVVARPCSNEYKELRPAVRPSGNTPGAVHVRSVENAVLFLKLVAMAGGATVDVTKTGNLFAGAATAPASATALACYTELCANPCYYFNSCLRSYYLGYRLITC